MIEKLNEKFVSLNHEFNIRFKYKSAEEIFPWIYETNLWNDKSSRSGKGSNLYATKSIRANLPNLLNEFDIKTILDIPCGDFFWIKEVNLPVDCYIGADIVSELISNLESRYANERYRFIKLNLIKDDLPTVDAVFCRDGLVHFSYHDIFLSLSNIINSNSKYLLTTTFPDKIINRDIITGSWRPLNLQAPPFNFPEPMRLVEDNTSYLNTKYAYKSIGVWNIADIPRLA